MTRSTAAACPSRSPTAMPPSSTRIEIPGATPASGSGGRKARLGDATWEGPVLAQVAGIALDDVTMTSVVAAPRLDRQIRELALEQEGGLLGDDTDRTRLRALRDQRDAIVERTAPGPTRAARSRVALSPRQDRPGRRRTQGEGKPDACDWRPVGTSAIAVTVGGTSALPIRSVRHCRSSPVNERMRLGNRAQKAAATFAPPGLMSPQS